MAHWRTRPLARRWLALLAGLLISGFCVGAWLTWRHDHLPALSLAPLVPEAADGVLWLDRLDGAARGLRRLTDRVAGVGGLREAVTLLAGLDLLDPKAVARAGLRPDAGVVLFRWQGAVWLVLPVAADAGAQHARNLLERRGYLVQGAGPWQIFDRTASARQVAQMRLAAGVLIVAWPLADKAAGLAEYDASPRRQTLTAGPGEVHAQLRLAPDGPELTGLHGLLGPANLILGGILDRMERLDLDLQLDNIAPILRFRLLAHAGALADVADYHVHFLDESPAALLDLGRLLPDETPLLLRARLNPALLGLVPQTLRDQYLPQSALGLWHPALNGIDFQRALLQPWDGQIALGLLAVANDLPLDVSTWAQRPWRKDLRFFVALGMHSDAEATALVGSVRTALETASLRPQVAQFREWAGFLVESGDPPWWLLQKGRDLALVSGEGEGQDLMRVANGKFPDLHGAALAAVEKSLVAGSERWAGALVETPRVARALRRRGVPDYVVQLVAGVQSIACGLTLDADALTLDLQLRPASAQTATTGEWNRDR